MTSHFFIGLGFILSGTMAASASECIVHDDFTSWSGTWRFDANTSSLRLEHYNQRAYANCYGYANVAPAFAWAAPDNWKIDLTQDWAMMADWYINPVTPNNGDTGMAFLIMFEGNPYTLDIQKGWTMGAGTYNAWDGYNSYESSNRWVNNVNTPEAFDDYREISDTVYVWWDASEKRIWVNDALYVQTDAFTSSFHGFANTDEAWIGFGSYAIGDVPSSFGNMYADNICIFEGNAIGAVVGACCMDNVCVQVPETACMGTFTGVSTVCNDCICEPQAGCTGDVDADNRVDATDLIELMDNWGESLECSSDPDGGTTIGLSDLLLVLANWGPCDFS